MQPACDISTLANPGTRGFVIDGESFFVVHRDGEYFTYRNQCPHLGVELEWEPDRFLDFEGVLIQCAMHGALFVIESGECVSGPCLGQALQPVPCRVEQGVLLVDTSGLAAAR